MKLIFWTILFEVSLTAIIEASQDGKFIFKRLKEMESQHFFFLFISAVVVVFLMLVQWNITLHKISNLTLLSSSSIFSRLNLLCGRGRTSFTFYYLFECVFLCLHIWTLCDFVSSFFIFHCFYYLNIIIFSIQIDFSKKWKNKIK